MLFGQQNLTCLSQLANSTPAKKSGSTNFVHTVLPIEFISMKGFTTNIIIDVPNVKNILYFLDTTGIKFIFIIVMKHYE
jgi:hypothetical protein